MNMPLRIGELVDFIPIVKPIERPEPTRWRLAIVTPQREFEIEKRLNYCAVRAYVPRERKERRLRKHVAAGINRPIPIILPIFSRIVFVPDEDAQSIDQLRAITGGVSDFVRFGGEIAIADRKILEQIRALEEYLFTSRAGRKRSDKFRIGDDVRVVDGALSEFYGRIERLDSKGRLKILLSMFGRQVSVMLNETQIEAI